ncbi:Isopenicillin N synthase [Loktanella atrilutea]|uniref:2-oxoglutarate-dependent ethylene/succinate-forming enzyme n=1 Tax=Loktanella atrilutea TaxID=366533 RepID=A0A1M5AZV4_LOKAT|nr:2-oxoglutarate and iron-dependent oxygenase domain-containing protein [Loktanella atrilutea]SHF35733.1 Isopenicillin N synthase [Loktanella atrilutea]
MTQTSQPAIPRISAAALLDAGHADHAAARTAARLGAAEIGFLTVHDTPLSAARVKEVIAAYRAFFALPAAEKARWDMARTGSNRGWGAPGSEQVNPDANPDYKQVYDCGLTLPPDDPLTRLPAYAPNLWPDRPPGFAETLQAYYADATAFARDLLVALLDAVGENGGFFADRFTRPMALLRGNFYPARPAGAGARDFGIATHTDYGCLTLLATDGTPGLEVRRRGGDWTPLSAPPGEFVINFGEMLEIWTAGRIVATPHRVTGGDDERISVPLFFNPDHDANVAPAGAAPIPAIDHLQARFDQTYVHLQKGR